MRTRFAPSPTGPLHLGHAYSVILAWDMAQSASGQFLLRIEDIDQSRARKSWEELIYKDLTWLGINWPSPVMRQSKNMVSYQTALQHLWDMGVLYECSCNRRDIRAAMTAPQEGAEHPLGPDGLIYPGTCRNRQAQSTDLPKEAVLRLDMAKALEHIGHTDLLFEETGPINPHIKPSSDWMRDHVGDVVLCRKDMGTSYHLSVVVDDAGQDITHVVRGEDLQSATVIHVLLQKLLGLPTPIYHHHRLIRDKDGRRLAKRDDARAIRLYRQEGETADDIRGRIGL
ncbi:MAG: tRNA glutamyl-Q(34) synthetase GluQRS [Pseudoruegeria sp.]